MLSSTLSYAALAAAATAVFPSLVQAKFECDTSLGNYYPYCINVPDGASSSDKLPTIVFLSGSGARGPASNVKSLSGYDGFGKLINQYLSGNKGDAQTMAAEKFVTVIPISPQYDGSQEVRHWWPEKLDDVYSNLKSKDYPIDWDQLHLSGYSMGGRGCWRNAVARPDLYASIAPSAGAAEKAGDGTLSQQKAPSVFDKLDLIKDLPVMQFAGYSDTTAGGDPPKSTESELKKIGNNLASLVMESADHSGMSVLPFDTTLMNWMLKQKRSGSSSSSSSDTSSNDDDDETEATSSKSGISKTRTSSSPSKTSSASQSQYTQDAQVKVVDDSDSGSGSSSSGSSSSSGKKKCSSAAKARRRAKRAAMSGYAHPGPVRRGIIPAPPSSNTSPIKKRGLSLAAIIAASEKHAAEQQQKKNQKRSLEDNLSQHLAAKNVVRSHVSPNKFGRRLSK